MFGSFSSRVMVENARKRLAGKKVDGESPEERKTSRRKKLTNRKALRTEYRSAKRTDRRMKKIRRKGGTTHMAVTDPGKWKSFKNRGSTVIQDKK